MHISIYLLQRNKLKNLATSTFLLESLVLAAVCQAQQPESPPKTAEKAQPILLQQTHVAAQKISLPAALTLLRKQCRLNFIVDGTPLAQQINLDVNGSVQDVLDALADAFDYNWTLTKSGIILMNKRFHNQQETPQVHLPEIKQTAIDMLNALKAFQSDADPTNLGDMVFGVAHSLSTEQLRALREGKRIPVTALPMAQYKQAYAAMLNACFAGTCRTWEDFLMICNTLAGSDLDADYYQDAANYTLFLTEGGKFFPYPFALSPSKITVPNYPEK